ncbi:uncharacterized protein LOC127079941 [Lathyrus oleraceus]|uniref:uncharacterized protein LOC127079941 n=1 Tax=Pisum sativum TaxID=3888 RepID=UPI0021D1349F|nr:uncharacterized protein LOC127079941 [Pisum sativum]
MDDFSYVNVSPSLSFHYSQVGNGLDSIDLYIKFQPSQQTEEVNAPSDDEDANDPHVNDPQIPSIIPIEDVEEDDVEDENEAQADHYFTSLFEEGECDHVEQEVENAIPINQVFCPPPHMTTLGVSSGQTSLEWPCIPRIPKEGDIDVGNKFKNKVDCVFAIKNYHMTHCLDYRVNISDKKRYQISCSNDLCKFRLVASYQKRSDLWEIGIMTPPHSCSSTILNQDHRKLSSQLMSQSLLPLVDKDPSTKVSICIKHIVSIFKFTPSYRKAWIARNKAIEQVYGNWENSYNELPRYLLALQKFVPGMVVEMQALPIYTNDDTIVAGQVMFHRLFWAFQPCIRGFAYCKPLLQIDGTWLYGKYKGTLLMAVAQDGNSNIFPVAFALVEGETAEGWGFFLKNLRRHVAPQPDLCLISDRHASIESAYNNPDNGWQDPPSVHVYCIRHIAQNFMREIKDRNLRKKVINMGYALNRPTFNYYRDEIASTNVVALRWVDNIPTQKWTRAFDEGRRWGHMTTNLVESMNSVFKGTRNLPITALKNCMKVMKEETLKSNTHQVSIFDYQHHTFSVKETMDHGEGKPMGRYKVNLQGGWCDCGKFQAFRVPCSHVIAACSKIRHDAYGLLSTVYKVSNLFGVYSNSFPVLPYDAYWPVFEGDLLCHNPSMRRNKKGRPVSRRIRTEMDTNDTLERKCTLCRLHGHNRSRCPNAGATTDLEFHKEGLLD